MIKNNSTNVAAVLDMLLEEIGAEIELVKRVGVHTIESGDYEKAKDVLERTKWITGFRDKADRLQQEWQALSAREENAEGLEVHTGGLAPGLRGIRWSKRVFCGATAHMEHGRSVTRVSAFFKVETRRSKRKRTKLVHEGNYVAEVDVELLEEPGGWSSYLSLEATCRIDDVREALRRGGVRTATQHARAFRLIPVV